MKKRRTRRTTRKWKIVDMERENPRNWNKRKRRREIRRTRKTEEKKISGKKKREEEI